MAKPAWQRKSGGRKRKSGGLFGRKRRRRGLGFGFGLGNLFRIRIRL